MSVAILNIKFGVILKSPISCSTYTFSNKESTVGMLLLQIEMMKVSRILFARKLSSYPRLVMDTTIYITFLADLQHRTHLKPEILFHEVGTFFSFSSTDLERQIGNTQRIFLPLRFYVKTILVILKHQKVPF